ncbi:hypothetical protein CEQ18_030005 [Pseudomonas aeruginosa]|nr:hypothetical protein CEQ18_030005 [Pseudomonas aeruginosa]
MLFAPTFADKAILPTAWGGRYFFNRIGRLRPLTRAPKPPPKIRTPVSDIRPLPYPPPPQPQEAPCRFRYPSSKSMSSPNSPSKATPLPW